MTYTPATLRETANGIDGMAAEAEHSGFMAVLKGTAEMLRQAAEHRERIDEALAYLGGWQKPGETPFDVGYHVAAILNGAA